MSSIPSQPFPKASFPHNAPRPPSQARPQAADRMAPSAARAPVGAPGARPSAPESAVDDAGDAARLRAAIEAANGLLLRADKTLMQDAVGLPCGQICDRIEVEIKERFRAGFLLRAERNPERRDELLESAQQTYRCDCCRQDIVHPASELMSQPVNGYLDQVHAAFADGVAAATDAEVLAFAQKLERAGHAIPTARPTALPLPDPIFDSIPNSTPAPAAAQGARAWARASMPAALLCPLTGEPFTDPILAEDGKVYERAAYSAAFDASTAEPCPFILKVMAAYQSAQHGSQADLDLALARSLVSEADGAPMLFPGIESTEPTRTVDLARALVDAAAGRPTGGRINVTLWELGKSLYVLPHVKQALAPALRARAAGSPRSSCPRTPRPPGRRPPRCIRASTSPARPWARASRKRPPTCSPPSLRPTPSTMAPPSPACRPCARWMRTPRRRADCP